MKPLFNLSYNVFIVQCIVLFGFSTIVTGCFIDDDGINIPGNNLDGLELGNGLTYQGLKKIVDAQKIYFIDNSDKDGNGVYIYEISLDYSQLAGSLVASPDAVYLRAEPFIEVGFKGHIAATIDNSSIVVLENGGSNIAVINIATKEINTYTKPEISLTQAGFDKEGVLYAAGGESFYEVADWQNPTGATFNVLNHTGLPKVSGGDLLFLDHKFKSGAFLSFSRGNDENDGDGAYLIDIIEKDSHGNPNKVSYQKVFDVDPKITGACVAGINQLITTHEGRSKANVYNSQGKKLFEIPIKTADGAAFIAGLGDLASVNSLDTDFYDEHITNGVIYLSSSEEDKIYELDLDTGNHTDILQGDFNSHIGVSNDMLYYTNHNKDAKTDGLYAWNMNTNEEVLLKEGLIGEKVVVFDDKVWVMKGNKLNVLDLSSNEIIHTQEFESIGGGGDLLVSKDKKHLLVFDRSNKKVWKIKFSNYSVSEPIDLPVQEANGVAYNEDGTYIVSSEGHLYILNEDFELIGEKLLGFTQNNGDMASTYFNY